MARDYESAERELKLRDQFAIAALYGLLSAANNSYPSGLTQQQINIYADVAYAFADAMMLERGNVDAVDGADEYLSWL